MPPSSSRANNAIPLDRSYYRINGTVANLPQFASTFFCKAIDRIVCPAAQPCKIW